MHRLLGTWLVFAAVSLAGAQTAPSSWRPIVHAQSAWQAAFLSGSIGDLTTVHKQVLNPDGSLTPKKVFHSVRLQGAKINNRTYQRSSIVSTGERTDNQASYTRYWGDYRIGPWTVRTEYILHFDGRFEFKNSFQGSQPIATQTELYLRVDYDLNGSTNIGEFMWGSEYGQAWIAEEKENVRYFSPVSQNNPSQVENNAYMRVVSHDPVDRQFYAIFWPPSTNVSLVPEVILYRKAYATDNGVMPPTMVDYVTQYVQGQQPSYYGQAWQGGDQVLYAVLKKASGANYYGIAGKVFQKPNGRSLQVHTHIESAAPAPNLTLMVNQQGNIKTALDELTDSRWSYNQYLNMAKNMTGASCKETVNGRDQFYSNCFTPGQIHNLITSWRSRNGAYSAANRANFQDWRVDMIVMSGRYSPRPATTLGVMNDFFIGDENDAAQEGAAVFYEPVSQYYGTSAYAALSAVFVHEMGHTFRMNHTWSTSPGDLMAPTLDMNNATMYWATYAVDWYRRGPESWVKPGKYGVDLQSAVNPFSFREYGTGNWISP